MIGQQLTLDATAPYQDRGAEGLPLITDNATGEILVHTPGISTRRLQLKWTVSGKPPVPGR